MSKTNFAGVVYCCECRSFALSDRRGTDFAGDDATPITDIKQSSPPDRTAKHCDIHFLYAKPIRSVLCKFSIWKRRRHKNTPAECKTESRSLSVADSQTSATKVKSGHTHPNRELRRLLVEMTGANVTLYRYKT
ncbi:unnamed protein product [Leptosia nina]|uniref:Uncharacterized protein n=1 Tax=Leptosia nina TaxID=320188 RepID=A0AAV1IY13_9NEOP